MPCKKKVSDFPVPSRDVTNQTLPGRESFYYSRPGRVWLVTPWLGTVKFLPFFTVWLLPSFVVQDTGFFIGPTPSHEMKLAGWNNITGIFLFTQLPQSNLFYHLHAGLFDAFSLSCLSFPTGEFFCKLSRNGGEEKMKMRYILYVAVGS